MATVTMPAVVIVIPMTDESMLPFPFSWNILKKYLAAHLTYLVHHIPHKTDTEPFK